MFFILIIISLNSLYLEKILAMACSEVQAIKLAPRVQSTLGALDTR